MTAFDVVAAGIRTASAISPRVGGAAAVSAFFSTRPRMALAARDAEVDAASDREQIEVRGRRVVVSSWGEGPVVVLAHGWRGRAAQFAPVVAPLVDAGHRVVAFDAPAHGRSAGGSVDIRDWIAALEALHVRHGRLRAIVGHSFGGFAAITAARRGLPVDAVAAIASAGRPAAFLDEFAGMLGLPPAARADMERRFLRRVDERPETVEERYDAVAHPLPATVPLLLVHGEADRQMPAERSRELNAAHPASRLVELAGMGHNRILGAPETRDAVLELLAGAAVR